MLYRPASGSLRRTPEPGERLLGAFKNAGSEGDRFVFSFGPNIERGFTTGSQSTVSELLGVSRRTGLFGNGDASDFGSAIRMSPSTHISAPARLWSFIASSKNRRSWPPTPALGDELHVSIQPRALKRIQKKTVTRLLSRFSFRAELGGVAGLETRPSGPCFQLGNTRRRPPRKGLESPKAVARALFAQNTPFHADTPKDPQPVSSQETAISSGRAERGACTNKRG